MQSLVLLGGGEFLEKLLEILELKLDFLDEEENGIPRTSKKKRENNTTSEGEISKATEFFINKKLRIESRKEMFESAKELLLNWLPQFLLILCYHQRGSLTFNKKTLTIYFKDSRHLDLAQSARTNIFLDATLSPSLLAQKLGIQTSDILHIEEEKPDYSNLTITQISGMGKLGRERSGSMQDERIPALKAALKTRHNNDVAFLDHKLYAQKGEGYHFRDSRGVNRFEGVPAITSFGLPYRNIGMLKAEFQILCGYCPGEDDENFKAYADELLYSEIIQEGGRLRASRTDKEKTFYIVAEVSTDFLAEAYPGANIKSQHITEICPEAANRGDRSLAAVFAAAQEVLSNSMLMGVKAVQRDIGAIAGVTQSYVSKVLKRYGGWDKFKKLFHLLIDSFNSNWNNSKKLKKLNDDEKYIATQWFPNLVDPPFDNPDPEDVVEEVMEVIEDHGIKKFKEILAHTPFETRVKMLGFLIQILPDYLQNEFIDILGGERGEPIVGF